MTYFEGTEKKEAPLVYSRGMNYCSAIEHYLFPVNAKGECERICKRINDARTSEYSDYAKTKETEDGILLIVTTPYDD